jgi:hypothetical protein
MSEPSPPRTIALHRKLLYSAILTAGLLGAVELASYQALAYKYPVGRADSGRRLHHYDPDIGWINIPGLKLQDRFGPGQHLTHNSAGFRALEDYTPEIPPGICRVICLGDSFTHGVCGDHETYAAQLQTLCPAIQAVNMGTGGFGLDQAYLWYQRDGVQLDTNLLVFAFIEDDFHRMQLPTFLARYPKPTLLLQNGELVVGNVPVPTWGVGAKSWWAEFPQSTSTYIVAHRVLSERMYRQDVVAVACAVFDDLQQLCQEREQELLLVYLPTQASDLARASPLPERIAAHAREANIPFLDLTPQFQSIPRETIGDYFQPQNSHYNARGNAVVARALVAELQRLFPHVVQYPGESPNVQ